MTAVTAGVEPGPMMAASSGGDADRKRIAALVAAASIEVLPRDQFAGERLRTLYAPGRTVFVNHPAGVTHHDIVAACARLRRAGFEPVPHVAARRLASFTQAGDFLARAAGEAAVESILLIAGDPTAPVGPFPDSMSLLRSGVIGRYGGSLLRRIAFAGYPEGHSSIAGRSLDAALHDKIALAGRIGLGAELVTQFGFDAAAIRRWIAGLRADGLTCPVRIGIAGPATIATLAKFAVRCGVGTALGALARGRGTAFTRILCEANPDGLIATLAADEATGGIIDGLHIFAFGGVRRAAEWADAHLSGQRSNTAP